MKKLFIFFSIIVMIVFLFSCDKEETTGTVLAEFEKPIEDIAPELYVYSEEDINWNIAIVCKQLESGDSMAIMELNEGTYYIVYKAKYTSKEPVKVRVQVGKVTKVAINNM